MVGHGVKIFLLLLHYFAHGEGLSSVQIKNPKI
jgi:hypothetical protein